MSSFLIPRSVCLWTQWGEKERRDLLLADIYAPKINDKRLYASSVHARFFFFTKFFQKKFKINDKRLYASSVHARGAKFVKFAKI
jgi:hypothetical protein